MQAEQQYRASIDDISSVYVKNANGEMTPLSTMPGACIWPRALVAKQLSRHLDHGDPAPVATERSSTPWRAVEGHPPPRLRLR